MSIRQIELAWLGCHVEDPSVSRILADPVAPRHLSDHDLEETWRAIRATASEGRPLNLAEYERQGAKLDTLLDAQACDTLPGRDAHRTIIAAARDRDLASAIGRAASASRAGRHTEALELIERAVTAARSADADGVRVLDRGQVIAEALEWAQSKASTASAAVDVIGCVIDGAVPGSLTVLGGQTGAGKSTIALYLADAYERVGIAPGVISLEDPASTWGRRIIGADSGADPVHASADGWDSIAEAAERAGLSSSRWAFPTRYDVSEVLAHMRRLVDVEGCGVIFVDYLQVVTNREHRGYHRGELLSAATAAMKGEAKRLGVPLFLGSQIKRVERVGGKLREPSIHDLKESGDIENMAEGVVLLWKDGDGEDATSLGKVGKLKGSHERPRFELRRGAAGCIARIEHESRQDDDSEYDGRWRT
jgi:replicative DNA helicase